MSLFSKIKKMFSSNSNGTNVIKLKVVCGNCGEEIVSYFRKNYDMQLSYGDEEYAYLIDKQLICSSCYQSIKLRLELDSNLNQLNSNVVNGEMLFESDD